MCRDHIALRRFGYRRPPQCRQEISDQVRKPRHKWTHAYPEPPISLTLGIPRLKQRTIHEQRETRKHRIAQLKADLACNSILEPRLQQIAKDVEVQGPPYFSQLVDKFKNNPSPDAPPTNAPEQKSYDEMLLSLLLQVWEDAKKAGADKDDPKLGDKLTEGLKKHVKMMGEHQNKLKEEIEKEEAEQKKKITSDDLHEGWDSHVRLVLYVISNLHGLLTICGPGSMSHRLQHQHQSKEPFSKTRPRKRLPQPKSRSSTRRELRQPKTRLLLPLRLRTFLKTTNFQNSHQPSRHSRNSP